jgi:Tol biopolymer transport system component
MEVALHSTGNPRVLMSTPAVENFSRISPDGRHLAYSSNAANVDHVFVQPYPDANGSRWQAAEGRSPLWTPDGRALLFIQQNFLKSVSVIDGRPVGTSKALVDMSRYLTTEGGQLDLSADGKRILTVTRETAVEPSTVSAQIIVTLNALATSARSSRP